VVGRGGPASGSPCCAPFTRGELTERAEAGPDEQSAAPPHPPHAPHPFAARAGHRDGGRPRKPPAHSRNRDAPHDRASSAATKRGPGRAYSPSAGRSSKDICSPGGGVMAWTAGRPAIPRARVPSGRGRAGAGTTAVTPDSGGGGAGEARPRCCDRAEGGARRERAHRRFPLVRRPSHAPAGRSRERPAATNARKNPHSMPTGLAVAGRAAEDAEEDQQRPPSRRRSSRPVPSPPGRWELATPRPRANSHRDKRPRRPGRWAASTKDTSPNALMLWEKIWCDLGSRLWPARTTGRTSSPAVPAPGEPAASRCSACRGNARRCVSRVMAAVSRVMAAVPCFASGCESSPGD